MDASRPPVVVMLLDNHYAPDPRVAFEASVLEGAGIATRVVAWDRRTGDNPDGSSSEAEGDLYRIAAPAASGGGWRTFLAMLRFGRRVWRRRRRLFHNAGVLVVHDVYLLPLGWKLSRSLRLPFVYDAHEEYGRMEASRYPSSVLRVVTAIETRLARSAAAVVVPGTSRRKRWETAGLVRAPIVLPNLVRLGPATPPRQAGVADWDVLYAGTISDNRRPDLLVELARRRPDLRIAVAGRGRAVTEVAGASEELPNLDYLGWRDDVEPLFERTGAIYYGLDPNHPYSDVACPNTLYQALLHRRPLVFFCGGEMAELADEFKIGVRSAANVDALSTAVDWALGTSDWEFDAARHAVWERAETEEFVEAVEAAMRSRD